MTKEISKGKNPQQVERCSECDRETDTYYTFLGPTNETRIICWECQMRDEKGFNTKRNFSRRSRGGVIPR